MEQSQYRPHLVASTSNPNAAIPTAYPQSSSRIESSSGPPFFKVAQWSSDGTTILTSTADKSLNTFVLPQDLLSSPTPQHLIPYTTHQSPEPVYATAFHPSFSLENSAAALYAASLRALPIRLLSPFSPSIIASYPLVSITTEEYIAPHSLLFSPYEPNTLFAGSLNLIATFDINRNGEGPLVRMPTIPSKRSKFVGGAGGIKGIVSALGMSSEGILAAGTFSRWIGLYDGQGRGGSVGAFEVREEAVTVKEVDGNGMTQVLWSNDGRYLCVVERCSDQVGVWDIRGTGKKLASLRGRKAVTNQRMSVDLVGNEVWAGGVDGMVRVWGDLGMKEGIVDPRWSFKAHDDAVSSTRWHYSGSVLATCSGQRHFTSSSHDDDQTLQKEEHPPSPSHPQSSAPDSETQGFDNSLKIWAF